MSIASEKTEVMLFPHNGKEPEEKVIVKYGGKELKVTGSKKVLGIILDYIRQQFKLGKSHSTENKSRIQCT